MDAHNISIEVGTRKVLHTAGTYCDRDIAIVATGDNYDKGYDAGYKTGYQNGYDGGHDEGYGEGHSDGRDYGYDEGLREGHSTGYQEGYTAGYDGGYDEGQYDGIVSGIEIGKKAEYDAFWDAYQDGGNRTNWDRAFNSHYWNDTNYNPKYDMTVVSGLAMFGNMKISDTKVAIDISNATNINSMFSDSATLTTIRKLIVSETTPFHESVFAWAAYLEEITFEGTIGVSISFANSSRLTTASVNSIINALKDLTGQATQNLSLHAEVKGKLTDAQKAAISAKNWTLG